MDDVEVRQSAVQGRGVFETRGFAQGERVLVIDDRRMVDADHPLKPGEDEDHCDYLGDGRAVLMQSPERYISSSCDPNVFVRTVDCVREVVARRDISVGEEIAYDYIIDCHGGEKWNCRCGSARCRGRIVSSFFVLPLKWQREYLPLLNPWFVEEHREKNELLRLKIEVA